MKLVTENITHTTQHENITITQMALSYMVLLNKSIFQFYDNYCAWEEGMFYLFGINNKQNLKLVAAVT